MTQRSWMLCLTMAIFASATLLIRQGGQTPQRAGRSNNDDEPMPKPALDLSLTSRTLPP